MTHKIRHHTTAVALAVATAILSWATPASGQSSGQTPGQSSGSSWPAGPSGYDLAAIEGELLAVYPWLGNLRNRAAVLGLFSRRIAWYRAAEKAIEERNALPDPNATIVSYDRYMRRKKRKPYERKRMHAAEQLGKLPERQDIAIDDLLAPDFVSAGKTVVERAALTALRASVRQLQGWLHHDLRGGDLQVFLYLNGSWLQLTNDRVHPGAFFHRFTPLFVQLQRVYYHAYAQAGRAQLGRMVASSPWIARAHFRSRVASQQYADTEARLHALGARGQARAVREVRRHRQQVAEEMRAEVASAMVPAIVVAQLFAVEGVSDIFLSVFPFAKATDVLRAAVRARKARKAARLADDIAEKLAGVLTREQSNFTRAVARLGVRDMRALARIHKRVSSPNVLTRLAVRAGEGQADLQWIDRLLARSAIDANTVDTFMRFDAYPSWRGLRAVVDNSVHGTARASILSKLIGFVGEQSAGRYVESAAFARRFRGNGSLTVVRGERVLDVIALTEDNKLQVFAEVKNWSATTWSSKSQLTKLWRQLERHDKEIAKASKGLGNPEPDLRVYKLLMVTPRGFRGLSTQAQGKIRAAVAKAGWFLEEIPHSHVEDVGAFISRLRKGT